MTDTTRSPLVKESAAVDIPAGLIYRIHNAPRLTNLSIPADDELRLVKLSREDCNVIIAALQAREQQQ